MSKICVLGAGSWGTAQAILLNNNGFKVTIWGILEDNLDTIEKTRENRRYLPGIQIPPAISLTTDISSALQDAQLVVLAVPSQTVRGVLQLLKPFLGDNSYLVNTAKGIEIATGMRLSQVAEDVLGRDIRGRYGILSGPSHAEEVARQVPTAVTVASGQEQTAFYIQDVFMSPVFRVYTNQDVAGVELGGALKNIVALATGIAHGLEYGDNTVAALMTRGLAEITRIGQTMGGNPRTFMGLSGMGDLFVTCCSKYSRNRRAGELIGRGYTLDETLEKVGMVVEGAHTTGVVYKLAEKIGVDMPITQACYNILFRGKPAGDEVGELMTRRKKHEIEEIIP